MRLVIAEKPSVAQSIAAVLGAKSRHDGYLEGGGYIVSWCFGHLAELADAAVYNTKSKTFSIEVIDMKTAFYCRVDGQGFGFVLPDEADKLREFFAEHQDKPALENPSSAS